MKPIVNSDCLKELVIWSKIMIFSETQSEGWWVILKVICVVLCRTYLNRKSIHQMLWWIKEKRCSNCGCCRSLISLSHPIGNEKIGWVACQPIHLPVCLHFALCTLHLMCMTWVFHKDTLMAKAHVSETLGSWKWSAMTMMCSTN